MTTQRAYGSNLLPIGEAHIDFTLALRMSGPGAGETLPRGHFLSPGTQPAMLQVPAVTAAA